MNRQQSTIVSDNKILSFSIDATGCVRAADFKTRSLRKALESVLDEEWKKSPKKLLKSMAKAPDLFAAVFAARRRMIPQYIEQYEALHEKVRELSAQGLKAMELTKDGLPSQDDLNAQDSNDIFETYAETRRAALRCHRALSLMQKTELTDWVQCMDKVEFKVLGNLLRELLERDITQSDCLYSVLKDSAEGLALSVLMQASPASVNPLGFSVSITPAGACAVVSDRAAFRAWCDEHGYEMTEIRGEAPKTAAKVTEKTPAKTTKTSAARAAKKDKDEAKATKKVRALDPEVKTQDRPIVKILKTEARLATARPKTQAPAPAQSQAAEKPADDLASRLVRSLQIAPSAVQHRAPGRPRKSQTTADAAPADSTRPASRNKSA